MIAGVGIDLVDLAELRLQLADAASHFVAGTFTALERTQVEGRPAADKTPHLGARFAAKEAFVKAWSAANAGAPPQLRTVDLREIEVVCDAFGRPALALHGAVSTAVAARGITKAHLSLTHSGGQAAAVVVLES